MKQLRHTIRQLLREEFRSLFRDEGVALILFAAPFIYILLYGSIYGTEVVREIPVAVIDQGQTVESRTLIRKLDAGPKIKILGEAGSMDRARELLFAGEIHGIIYLPKEFAHRLYAGQATTVSLYLDGSSLLFYREVFEEAATVIRESGAQIALERLIDRGENPALLNALIEPVKYRAENRYNPSLGYGIFLLPAVLILILQQTLLIGEGMRAATQRERGVVPSASPLLLLIVRTTTLVVLYLLLFVPLSILLDRLFGLPAHGEIHTLFALLVPYLLATSFLAQAVGSLFHRREDSLLFLLATSIPLLMISGVSLPREALPAWLYRMGEFIPSSPAMRAYIRIRSMGASGQEVGSEILQLWGLVLLYGLAAFGALCKAQKTSLSNKFC